MLLGVPVHACPALDERVFPGLTAPSVVVDGRCVLCGKRTDGGSDEGGKSMSGAVREC